MIGWKGWKRGDICVARDVNGLTLVLRIVQQNRYQEWVGCFSII